MLPISCLLDAYMALGVGNMSERVRITEELVKRASFRPRKLYSCAMNGRLALAFV